MVADVSDWVKTEAAEGAARQILVPAIIEDVPIPIEFRRIQAANLQHWTGNPDDLELESLIQSVERLSRGVGSPRVDHHAPGSVVPRARRVALRAMARMALIPAVVAASFLMGWVLSRTGAPLASDSGPAEMSSDRPVVPKVSFGNPAATPVAPVGSVNTSASGKKVNLLAMENGGHLVVASSDDWRGTIDGKENPFQISYGTGKEAVYAFKDDRLAAFDTFAMLINETEGWNINEFELLASREASSGPFDAIGKYHTQNLKNFAAPYQTFTFPLVEAKYLKFKLISTHGGAHPVAHEFQLLGILMVGPS